MLKVSYLFAFLDYCSIIPSSPFFCSQTHSDSYAIFICLSITNATVSHWMLLVFEPIYFSENAEVLLMCLLSNQEVKYVVQQTHWATVKDILIELFKFFIRIRLLASVTYLYMCSSMYLLPHHPSGGRGVTCKKILACNPPVTE